VNSSNAEQANQSGAEEINGSIDPRPSLPSPRPPRADLLTACDRTPVTALPKVNTVWV
jgi:hypothetical protein